VNQELGTVVCACNPSTWEAEAGGSQIQGHPGLYNETHLKKKKTGWGDLIHLLFPAII
jgi:hypothetical protein